MGANKEAHSGDLKNLYLPAEQKKTIKADSRDLPSWTLTHRQICDIELLLNGAFSPLEGFMGQTDYNSVLKDMYLEDGTLWPMPITLDVSEKFAEGVATGKEIALRDEEGVLIAILAISDKWFPDKSSEARAVFGTEDTKHPAVNYLFTTAHPVYLGGKLKGIEPPMHYDFKHLRDTPAELRKKFRKMGWRRVVAFQTRNPLHRAHFELTRRAAQEAEANLLIHPVVGMTAPGDVDHYTRVRCYEHVLEYYPEQTTQLSLLPLAMRMGGPREALWHAIIRKNYGCTHMIVGRDHAGPGTDSKDKPFYGPYDAQQLMADHAEELGITMVPFKMVSYLEDKAQYVPADEVEEGKTTLTISGAELRRRLREGLDIPGWFSFPSVIDELRKTHPPMKERGVTIFFTGLSGSGKSTIANALLVKLMEIGGRPVTLLDGDIVRKNLSSELGFSKEHRDLNIQRIGFVAAEITKNRGVAICAPIAPYTQTRRQIRERIEAVGGFIEVYVSTPIEICEQRDRKGLYIAARAGKIKGFTGIDDPYEVPERAELVIDTVKLSPDLAAHKILLRLEAMGYV